MSFETHADPDLQAGSYANALAIWHTAHEFTFDFPGLDVAVVLRPGQAPGLGQLYVTVGFLDDLPDGRRGPWKSKADSAAAMRSGACSHAAARPRPASASQASSPSSCTRMSVGSGSPADSRIAG